MGVALTIAMGRCVGARWEGSAAARATRCVQGIRRSDERGAGGARSGARERVTVVTGRQHGRGDGTAIINRTDGGAGCSTYVGSLF